MTETILSGARIVTADAVLDSGTLVLEGERILAVEPGRSHAPGAIDASGETLLPGFVELHTDTLERHFGPRPGVRWPALHATLAHDAQIAAAGITTVLDAVALGDIFQGTDRILGLKAMMAAIREAGAASLTRSEHLLHLRCEVTHDGIVGLLTELADLPEVRLVSVMDHTPGQRQFVDHEVLKAYYQKKYGMSDEAFARFKAERMAAHHRYAQAHRRAVVEIARSHGLALASHDDATEAHVAEAVADGMTIAEFPTTLEAAGASHGAGLAVLIGGPNLVLGGSHSGNIAAADLARGRLVDVVSSDYVPTSILPAAMRLTEPAIGMDLPAAIRCISFNPARAVGLDDRGALAPGLRADLVRARPMPEDGLMVAEVWRGGRRVL